jgi:hypothetical protein
MRGVQGGVAENGDFRQGTHYPWVLLGGGWINLSVTGNGGPSFTGVILALRVTGTYHSPLSAG